MAEASIPTSRPRDGGTPAQGAGGSKHDRERLAQERADVGLEHAFEQGQDLEDPPHAGRDQYGAPERPILLGGHPTALDHDQQHEACGDGERGEVPPREDLAHSLPAGERQRADDGRGQEGPALHGARAREDGGGGFRRRHRRRRPGRRPLGTEHPGSGGHSCVRLRAAGTDGHDPLEPSGHAGFDAVDRQMLTGPASTMTPPCLPPETTSSISTFTRNSACSTACPGSPSSRTEWPSSACPRWP